MSDLIHAFLWYELYLQYILQTPSQRLTTPPPTRYLCQLKIFEILEEIQRPVVALVKVATHEGMTIG
jgi:hypothetical protein